MTLFHPKASRELCQLAHTAALQESAPYALPAYRKRDRDLKRRAYFKGKIDPTARDSDLMDQLHGTIPPPDDGGWFEKRWMLGEDEAVRETSERIAKDANELGTFGLNLLEQYELTASAAIRYSLASESTILVSMKGSAYHVLLAGIAAKARPLLALSDLSYFDRHVLELHVASTILIACNEFSEHVDQLLHHVGRDLLPQPGSEGIAQAQLQRLAETVLEQPHGEVERIASGMHQGRTDRLHRAWSRGFFLPRGVNLEQLLASFR